MKLKFSIFLISLCFMAVCVIGKASPVFALANYVWDYYTSGQWSTVNYYTDAEKDSSAPNNYCWAAAAANILTWSGWDGGFADEDAIFDEFQLNWSPTTGSWARFGWEWWFTGGVDPNDVAYQALGYPGQYNAFPGYYPGTHFTDSLYKWEDLRPYGVADLTVAATELMYVIDNGYGTTLQTIDYATNEAHNVTLWGYDTHGSADILSDGLEIFITDSDDTEGVTHNNILASYWLYFNSNAGVWWLDDYYGNDNSFVGSLAGLLPNFNDIQPNVPSNSVPEPTTILLMGTSLIAFGVCRKRIKKG